MANGLLDKRLVVVTGKGGVGKSTVSAALALCARAAGKRVLCCEVAARERIAPLLGHEPSGPVIAQLEDDLYSINIEAQEAMREYALMKLKFETIYNAVFENRLVRAFLRLIPSLAETVLLGKVWFEVEAIDAGSPRWDLVILDAPATGHGMSFLGVPQALLDTVPPGALRDDAQKMYETLTDPKKTSLQLVTLPEDMPVNETIELHTQLREVLNIPLGTLFLNGVVPRRFEPEEVERLEELRRKPSSVLTVEQGAATAGIYHANRAALSEQYARKLAVEIPDMPLVKLPRMYEPGWGREQVETLSAVINAALAQEPA